MRTGLPAPFLLAALAALHGCSVLEKRAEPVLPGAAVRAGPGFLELSPWWQTLGDTHLDQMVRLALEKNPEPRLYASRFEAARHLARAEAARGLPTGETSAAWQHGRHREHETGFRNRQVDPWEGAATLLWELDLLGRIAARRQAARETAHQREADWHGARLSLSAEVASAYLTPLHLNEERRIVAEIVEASNAITIALRDREEAGLASSPETGRQDAETESLRRMILEIDRQRLVAAARLDTLLGAPAGSSSPLAGSLSEAIPLPALPPAIPAERLRRRPDLAAAEAAVRSAFAGEEAKRLDLYPSLTLHFDGLAAAGAFTGPLTSWLAAGGPRLTLPLLNPVARAEVHVARAGTDGAVISWELALLHAAEELETAAIGFQSRRAQLSSARRESTQLRTVWETTRQNFQGGVVSQLEVLEDQRRYLASRRSQLALHHQALLDYITLVKAAGGGW